MKKKVLMAAIAAVVSVGAYAGFNSYRANSGSSDLLLENAEALSTDEVVTFPCVVAPGKKCTFPAEDADGNKGEATIDGMKKK